MNKILQFLETLYSAAKITVFGYMWMASCHYLFFNVNEGAAQGCFYVGLLIIILSFVLSPNFKKRFFK